MTNRPLDGIRVIDFSRVLAGPLIGQLLGDLGADVIKVERPGHGDDTRTWGPPWHEREDGDEADATYYLSLNRNKRSIVLDLKDADDLAFAQRLARTGDIVLDNFKPGFTERLGIDRASLATTNPAVITATITAFGAASDAAHLPGYDLVAQGMGGLMHLTGEADGRPLRVGVPLIDMFAGYNATVGVLAALAEMRATGVGRHVEVSLYDAALHSLLNHQTAVLMADADPARGGNRHPSIAPYESYTCADGDIIIAAANDKLFAGLCRVINRTDLIDDPRFVGNTIRRSNVHELNEIVNGALAADTRAAWIEKLRAEDVPCGPINSLPEAIEWGIEMNMETIVEGADGYRSVRNPIRLDGEVATQARRPPRLGEHDDEIRAEVAAWSDR
jgi:crotonobetainyl-CoA:carnitine CoA-transferase CaiB-like acyl-CoA transferase